MRIDISKMEYEEQRKRILRRLKIAEYMCVGAFVVGVLVAVASLYMWIKFL